eukprot:TRINITY_DN9085_c0_g1_i3.p1 TRINITY_DN9085_c0_g1~~TRINITY_DN9085_c0_g1_i3.p1  ORF type:complete len:625 (+),score=104.42 TRINITY_DN9085_c0_g1_i3:135-2009(+)
MASKLKDQGNKCFKNGQWEEAAILYTEAIECSSTDLHLQAVLHLNRAFASLKAGRPYDALRDLQSEAAFERQTPALLKKRLYRLALAHYSIGDIDEAERFLRQCNDGGQDYKLEKALKNKQSPPSWVEFSRSSSSSHLCVQTIDAASGRGIMNTISTISGNERLWTEAPFAAVLLDNDDTLICHGCLMTSWCLQPITAMHPVMVCSQRCRSALTSTASFEHLHRDELRSLSAWYLAARVAFKLLKGLSYHTLAQWINDGSSLVTFPFVSIEPAGRERQLCEAVWALEPSSPSQAVPESFPVDAFIASCKDACAHCNRNGIDETSADTVVDDDGGWLKLLLRHCHAKVERNSFGVHRMTSSDTKDRIVDIAQHTIGKALYARTSMLNHSCHPNAIVTFDGASLTVTTERPIQPNEQVVISYGPLLPRTPWKPTRQALLKQQFAFDCRCAACVGDVRLPSTVNCLLCRGDVLIDSQVFSFRILEDVRPKALVAMAKCQNCHRTGTEVMDLVELVQLYRSAKDVCQYLCDNARDVHGRQATSLLDQGEAFMRGLARLFKRPEANLDIAELHDQMAQACMLLGLHEQTVRHLKASIAALSAVYGKESKVVQDEQLKLAEIEMMNSHVQ